MKCHAVIYSKMGFLCQQSSTIYFSNLAPFQSLISASLKPVCAPVVGCMVSIAISKVMCSNSVKQQSPNTSHCHFKQVSLDNCIPHYPRVSD